MWTAFLKNCLNGFCPKYKTCFPVFVSLPLLAFTPFFYMFFFFDRCFLNALRTFQAVAWKMLKNKQRRSSAE